MHRRLEVHPNYVFVRQIQVQISFVVQHENLFYIYSGGKNQAKDSIDYLVLITPALTNF